MAKDAKAGLARGDDPPQRRSGSRRCAYSFQLVGTVKKNCRSKNVPKAEKADGKIMAVYVQPAQVGINMKLG